MSDTDIVVMVMTDGRQQYMAEMMESLDEVAGFTRVVIHDDSGNGPYQQWLRRTYRGAELAVTQGRQGFAGAYASAWRWLTEQPEPWVFQTEDDFTFNQPVDLHALRDVLEKHPHIAQIVLRRQPWWIEPAGGFIGQWPELYTDAGDGTHHWLEHRRNWSTNPSLFRRSTCERGWPLGVGSEAVFGDRLMAEDPETVFAVWGQRDDPPAVTHIGHERIGHTY